jgi:hypothetical protein
VLQIVYLDRYSSINTARLSTGLFTGNATISLLPVQLMDMCCRIVSLPHGDNTGKPLLHLAHGPQATPHHEVDTVVVTRHQQPKESRKTSDGLFYSLIEDDDDPVSNDGDVDDDDDTIISSVQSESTPEQQNLELWYTVSPFRNASRLTVLHPDGSEEPFTVDIRTLLATRLPETVIYPVADVENTDLPVTDPTMTLPDAERALVAPIDGNGRAHIIRLQKPITLPAQTISDRVLLLGSSRRLFNRLRPFALAAKHVPTNPYCLIYFLQDNVPIAPPILATPEVALFPPLTAGTPESTVLDIVKLQLAMEWAAYGNVPGDFPFKHPALCTRSMAALFINAACLRLEPYVDNVVYEMLQTNASNLAGPYGALEVAHRMLSQDELLKRFLASYGIHDHGVPPVRWFPEPGVYTTPIIAALPGYGERDALRLLKLFWCRDVRRLHKLAVSIRTIEDYTVEDITDEETDEIWI